MSFRPPLLVLGSVLLPIAARPHSPGVPQWVPLLQPTVYTSADGGLRLHVRSNARDWRSGGQVRLERDGEVVYERALDHAPWDASVLPDGRILVFAYREVGAWSSYELLVALLDPVGNRVWEAEVPNQRWYEDEPPTSALRAPRWALHRESAQVLFELSPRPRPKGPCPLQVLDLDAGTDLGRIELEFPELKGWRGAELLGFEVDAAGDRLLAAWERAPVTAKHPMQCAVALHELPRRMKAKAYHDATEPLAASEALVVGREVAWKRAVEAVIVDGTVTLRPLESTSPSEAPDSEEPAVADLEELEPLELQLPELERGPDDRSLYWIQAFGFDDQGNVEVLSTTGDRLDTTTARTLDRAGRVLAHKSLGALDVELDYTSAIGDGPNGTWIVALNANGGGAIVRLDIARGVREDIMTVRRNVETVVAFPDGGFAYLESPGLVRCCDPDGRPIALPAGGVDDTVEYDALGRSASGGAVALATPDESGLMRVLLLWDGGRKQRVVEVRTELPLDECWPDQGLFQVSDSTFWIALQPFQGRPSLREIDFEGKVVTQLEPQLADGSEFPFDMGRTDVAPDGTIWCGNPNVLAAVAPSGPTPIAFLGRLHDPVRWDGWHRWSVAANGSIVVRSDERCAVLFDAQGRATSTLHSPTTMEEPSGWLSFVGSSEIWWRVASWGPFARFGVDGEHRGIRRWTLEEEHVQFIDDGLARWTSDGEEVVRRDADGTVVERLATRPDGAWWRDVADLALSADGSILLVADALRAGGRRPGASLAIHDLRGGASWLVDAPVGGWVSVAGDWVCWSERLVHLSSRTVWRVRRGLHVVATPRGPELWEYHDPAEDDDEELPRPRFRRFALPPVD